MVIIGTDLPDNTVIVLRSERDPRTQATLPPRDQERAAVGPTHSLVRSTQPAPAQR